MATLTNRPNTALIVVDVQGGVVEGAFRRDDVIANINVCVAAARSQGVPVIWVRHSSEQLVSGSDSWKIVPELQPLADETIVEKQFGDSFEATLLEEELARLEVGKVVVTGAQTDACIRSTSHGAFVRGYDTLLVRDAHTTEDLSPWGAPAPEQVIAHTNLYWSDQTAPGRIAGVLLTSEVSFS